MKERILFIVLSFFLCTSLLGQRAKEIFHPNDSVLYFEGVHEPDSDWMMTDYNDEHWKSSSTAVLGRNYNVIGYTVVSNETKSIYLRGNFFIDNSHEIEALILMVDFDDAYIAYLNGVEIARVNLPEDLNSIPYNTKATRSHKAEFVTQLTNPVLGVYIDRDLLDACLVEGGNVMAIQVLDDDAGMGLLVIPYLLDITNYKFNVWSDIARHKRIINIDSSTLPLVVIETDRYGIFYDQSKWRTATMKVFDSDSSKWWKSAKGNEFDGFISIRSRGQSSKNFAKKSYRLELLNHEKMEVSSPLLGMPNESDWILFGPYTDKSLIRNKLIFELSRRMGNYAPRSRFCELIINGQCEGLYMLVEQIKRDKNRIDIAKLTNLDIYGNDVTGGYIFKYDRTDANSKKIIRNREIVYPNVLQAKQEEYLDAFFGKYDKILSDNSFLDPENGFRKYASDSSLVDFIILNEIAKNADAYLYSSYMFKDRDDLDGRMKFGPMWDNDLAFGNTFFKEGNVSYGWQWDINKNMNITRYLQDVRFVRQLQDRWWNLRKTTLSNDSIMAAIDFYVVEIEEARVNNYEIWPIIDKELYAPGYQSYTYLQEIYFLQKWIVERMKWIDSNINSIYYSLDFNQINNAKTNPILSVFPNPFSNHLTITFTLDSEQTCQFELVNLSGEVCFNQTNIFRKGMNKVYFSGTDIVKLPKGFYLLKINVEKELVATQRLFKN